MSESQHKQRGQYQWTLSGGHSDALKWVAELLWESALDRADQLTVRLVPPGKHTIVPKDYPATVEIKWQGKILFKGHLHGFTRVGVNGVSLRYMDSMYKLQRFESNSLLKDCTLQEGIDSLAKLAGLTTRFHGGFSDPLPSLYLGGKTAFQHLRDLSESYGFFFYAHAPSEVLHLYRLGAETQTMELQWKQDVAQFGVDVRSDLLVSGVDHRFFDPGAQAGQSKTLQGE